ncbi:hypothetical protein EJ04DRAFT_45454 [Polyplosphaeria fusca]|uniref:Uncharacterized protein n=1 Tax=Polyplosphaeria fusca TaxID=682080 RepID=A0A9P4UZ05_9PLEO|nr:hypothetical protein EJ04DRAFT_45454 [Polyplosphaeria fusca]
MDSGGVPTCEDVDMSEFQINAHPGSNGAGRGAAQVQGIQSKQQLPTIRDIQSQLIALKLGVDADCQARGSVQKRALVAYDDSDSSDEDLEDGEKRNCPEETPEPVHSGSLVLADRKNNTTVTPTNMLHQDEGVRADVKIGNTDHGCCKFSNIPTDKSLFKGTPPTPLQMHDQIAGKRHTGLYYSITTIQSPMAPWAPLMVHPEMESRACHFNYSRIHRLLCGHIVAVVREAEQCASNCTGMMGPQGVLEDSAQESMQKVGAVAQAVQNSFVRDLYSTREQLLLSLDTKSAHKATLKKTMAEYMSDAFICMPEFNKSALVDGDFECKECGTPGLRSTFPTYLFDPMHVIIVIRDSDDIAIVEQLKDGVLPRSARLDNALLGIPSRKNRRNRRVGKGSNVRLDYLSSQLHQQQQGGYIMTPQQQQQGGYAVAPQQQHQQGGYVVAPQQQYQQGGYMLTPQQQQQHGGYMLAPLPPRQSLAYTVQPSPYGYYAPGTSANPHVPQHRRPNQQVSGNGRGMGGPDRVIHGRIDRRETWRSTEMHKATRW